MDPIQAQQYMQCRFIAERQWRFDINRLEAAGFEHAFQPMIEFSRKLAQLAGKSSRSEARLGAIGGAAGPSCCCCEIESQQRQ